MRMSEEDIWKDPMVKEALTERAADDIMVMPCPECGKWSYYNQGSHFSCRFCDMTFYVLADFESKEDIDGPCVWAHDAITLADTLEVEDGL